MNTIRVREALQTALMLSQVSSSNHRIELFEIGEILIQHNRVSVLNGEGHFVSLTENNVEERLDQLLAGFDENHLKDRLQEMIFAGQEKPTELRKVS